MRFPTINQRLASTALALLLTATSVRAERREFVFEVDVRVDNTGVVTKADVIAEITPEFEATLVKMVRSWKFQPGTRGGTPAVVDTSLSAKVIVDINEGKSATVVARYTGHGPRYLQVFPPVYPERGMRRGVQGEIILLGEIAPNGSTKTLSVHAAHVRGGKFAANLLSKSAMDAVRNWRFKPERIDGIAVGGRVLIPVMFSLHNGPVELETIIAPPAEDAARTAALKSATEGTHALALENSTGLEFISDDSQG